MPAVQPRYGPTLPALARRRLGLPAPVTIGIVALAALALVPLAFIEPNPPVGEQLIVRGEGRTFNLLYDEDVLRPAAPQPGELTRIEGRRPGARFAVAARALDLPPYRGDVARGQLPIYANRHLAALRARFPGFVLRQEGRGRVNDAVGYQLEFTARHAGTKTTGIDVLLIDERTGGADAIAYSFRQVQTGPLDKGGFRLAGRTRKAFRSFRWGTGRG